MKVCPICAVEYSDNAQFCKKCETVLIEKPKQQEKVDTDYKRLFLMVLYTFLFISFIAGLYFVFGQVLFR